MIGYALTDFCCRDMDPRLILTPKQRTPGATDGLTSEVSSPNSSNWYSHYQSPGLWNTRKGVAGKQAAQLGRGQLKLAISYDLGHLTVHVMQARQLGMRREKKCSTFVKINLLPDDRHIDRHCETEVAYDTNQPTYDEKFTFELMEEDKKKRLLISVMDKSTSSAECLGCMSFGVRHLTSKKKEVNSWYYLLSEDVGKRKHLQLCTARPVTKPKKGSVQSCIPQVNKAVQGMENLTVVLKRGKTGFGFTVMGSSPVTVGRIDAGSSAENSGLQRGDAVVRINGLNVSRSTADSVAKVVKNSPKQMVLDVYRVQNKENNPPSAVKVNKKENLEPIIKSARSTPSKPSLHWPQGPYECKIERNLKDNYRDKDSPHSKLGRIEPELNAMYNEIGFRDSQMITMDSQMLSDYDSCYDVQDDTMQLLNQKRPPTPSIGGISQLSHIRPNTPQSRYGSELDSPFINHLNTSADFTVTEDGYTMMTEDSDSEDDSDYELDKARITLPELSSSSNNETCSDDQQAFLDDLISLEEEYVREMQAGIQAFSRPLRHCILTPYQHAHLFQNVEKLATISEFHLRSLKSSQGNVGDVYESKVKVLSEAYEHYCKGIHEAFRLLSSLGQFTEFTQFIQNIPSDSNQLSLEEFLRLPVLHLHNLTQQLDDVRKHCVDSTPLDGVVIALQRTCLQVVQLPEPRMNSKFNSMMSFASVRSRASVESRQSCQSRASSMKSVSSVGSTMSVDSEVLEIQSRLLFPKHLQAVPVASPNRHLIYTGELMWIVDGTRWERVHVLLFNDLLLIVQLASKNYFNVIHDPIPLTEVLSADFSNKHPSQFSLAIESNAAASQRKVVTFRAFTIEQKCTWKSLLELRISARRNQRELMSYRTGDIII